MAQSSVVEIGCLQYEDLKLVTHYTASDEEIMKAQAMAVNQVFECSHRCLG